MGENGAGKSTLMKILAGAYRADSGEIILDGKPVQFRTPHEARVAGIGIIYQELTVAPNLTVSGNVFLGSELKRFGFIKDTAEMDRKTQEVLNRLGARFKATERAARLAVAEQQQVEIARALFYKSRVLVMDEPTAALSDRETDRLFDVVRQLRSEGLAIIYISHRMAEVYELADRLSVLRDGEYVGELKRSEFSADKVIEMMVGRRLEDFYEHTRHSAGRVVLEVKNMSDGNNRVKNANFQLRQGELLGLAGLVGAGRTELARLIFGADKRKSGEVYLDGKKLQINQPKDAMRAGIGYVPEDRKLQGVFLQMSSARKHYAEHFGALLVRWCTQLQKVDRTGECGSEGHAGSDSIAEAASRGALRRESAKALVSALARNQSEGSDFGRTNARSRRRRQS